MHSYPLLFFKKIIIVVCVGALLGVIPQLFLVRSAYKINKRFIRAVDRQTVVLTSRTNATTSVAMVSQQYAQAQRFYVVSTIHFFVMVILGIGLVLYLMTGERTREKKELQRFLEMKRTIKQLNFLPTTDTKHLKAKILEDLQKEMPLDDDEPTNIITIHTKEG